MANYYHVNDSYARAANDRRLYDSSTSSPSGRLPHDAALLSGFPSRGDEIHAPGQYTTSLNAMSGLISPHQQGMHHSNVSTRLPASHQGSGQAQYPSQYDPRFDHQQSNHQQSNSYGYRPQEMQGFHTLPSGRMDMEDHRRIPALPQPQLHIQPYDSVGSHAYSHNTESIANPSRYQGFTAQTNAHEPLRASTIEHSETQANRGSLPNSPTSETESNSGKRIIMACHQCRARKIRCDAERPLCKNCRRRHEECIYDVRPKRRGPDKIPGARMRSCKSKNQQQFMLERGDQMTHPVFVSLSPASIGGSTRMVKTEEGLDLETIGSGDRNEYYGSDGEIGS